MSEEIFVRHCAPTLAGIKTGSLFSCEFADSIDMSENIKQLNRRLNNKGLRILPLKFERGRALIYAYRPLKLFYDFQCCGVRELLGTLGYDENIPEKCIVRLKQKLNDGGEFPHEIGLFLGYPLEDVCGFIQNKAKGYKCIGEWKVYGDEETAKKLFAKYRKCTEIYCRHLANGKSVERLTTAG